jgi:uncharacterized membrane protein
MKFSIKTTLFSLLALCFTVIGYSQSEAKLYMLELLEQENIAYQQDQGYANLDNAMKVLDARKEQGKITEAEFQKGLGRLMPYKQELRELTIAKKQAINDKNTKEYAAKKARGETTDMFDLAKDRLKAKLDAGKISQSQYDEKLESYNQRQAERKARKAGN